MPEPTHDPTERRLTSLEEAAMFQDQAAGELREATEEALRRVVALERRLEAMEHRLGHLVRAEPEPSEGPVPPAGG